MGERNGGRGVPINVLNHAGIWEGGWCESGHSGLLMVAMPDTPQVAGYPVVRPCPSRSVLQSLQV